MVRPIKTTDKSGWESLSPKKARLARANNSKYIIHDDIFPHNYEEPPFYIRKVYLKVKLGFIFFKYREDGLHLKISDYIDFENTALRPRSVDQKTNYISTLFWFPRDVEDLEIFIKWLKKPNNQLDIHGCIFTISEEADGRSEALGS